LEYIDLYLIHSPNPGPKLRKESWDALQHLVAKDKVKSIGNANERSEYEPLETSNNKCKFRCFKLWYKPSVSWQAGQIKR
jgi:diketogulonate reductase-like aldo/keto reductase